MDVSRPMEHGILADLDGDVYTDVVASAWDEAGSEGRLLFWVRRSATGWSEQEIDLGPSRPDQMVAIDIDADGRDHLVVAFPDDLSLRLYGLEGDTLVEEDSIPVSHGVTDISVEDLDGDEQPEVLIALGAGGIGYVRTDRVAGLDDFVLVDRSSAFLSASAGDLDDDGDQDIVGGDGLRVAVFCNRGGRYTFHSATESGGSAPVVRAVLIDDDRREDVAVAQGSAVRTFISRTAP
jgi:hypothetical protein